MLPSFMKVQSVEWSRKQNLIIDVRSVDVAIRLQSLYCCQPSLLQPRKTQNLNRQTSATTHGCEDVRDGFEGVTLQINVRNNDSNESLRNLKESQQCLEPKDVCPHGYDYDRTMLNERG